MSTRIYKVVLGLRGLTSLQLIQLITKVINMITGNVSVPSPVPTILQLQALRDDYSDARNALEAAKNTLKQCKATEVQKRKALELGLNDEARLVDSIAHGDKAIIESCGMTASDDPSPVHLDQVSDLSLTRGDNPGSVDGHWHAILKSTDYTVEISNTAPDIHGVAPWTFYSNSAKSSITISGLTSGSLIWVHVCANGSGNTKGAFSDPAELIVP